MFPETKSRETLSYIAKQMAQTDGKQIIISLLTNDVSECTRQC